MLLVCFGFAGAFLGCDDSSPNDANPPAFVCETGAKQCEGNTLQECNDNAWNEKEVCEHGCDADKKACKTEGDEPVPEDKVCTKNECKDEKTQKICAEDGMSFSEEKPCGDDEKCVDGACISASDIVCETGKKECDAEKGKNAYRECIDNAWTEKTCKGEKVCSEGECVDDKPVDDTCEGDAIKCSEDKTGFFVCTEGKWSTEVSKCGEKEVCDAEQKKCVEEVPPECEKDQIKCADDKSYVTCADGKWGTEKKECADGKLCDSTSNTCEEKCTNNTTKCSADLKETLKCDNGAWKSDKKCKDKQLCIKSECKDTVCTPKQDVCAKDPSNGKNAMWHCTDEGQLGELVEADTYCSGECIKDKTACLVCNEGDLNCTDKGTDKGIFQICEKNAWVDKVTCGENQCSKDNWTFGCKCQLKDGGKKADLRCNADSSKIEICSSLKSGEIKYKGWVDHQDCAGKKCETKDNSAICKCEKEEFSCNDKVLQLCNNGVLSDEKVCNDKETCDASKMTCVCKDGDRMCNGKDSLKCIGGAWVDDKCKEKETCNDALGGVCIAKDSMCKDTDPNKCIGNIVVKCSGGVYDIAEICSTDCQEGKCTSSCTPNTKSCSADYKSVVSCSDKKEETSEACKADERCVERIEKGKWAATCEKKVCDEMAMTCEGTSVNLCYSNEKKAVFDCATLSFVCKEGACVAK